MILEFDREKIGQFFYAIKEQTDEGLLHIGNNELHFSSVDSANVCFIDAKYNIETSENLDIAVDTQKFYSTVNALKSKNITIDFNKNCKICGAKISREIRAIDPNALRKQIAVPSLSYPVIVELPATEFVDILESIEKIGNEEGALPLKVWLAYDKDKFVVYSINELKEMTRSEFDIITTEKGEGSSHKSGYSFDYMIKIAKVIKRNKIDNVKVHLNTDYPCKIEINGEIVSIAWNLAPRIEED